MLATITTLVGVLTLVVGVATFILTEIDKRRRAIASVLRTWQADTIAYIVDDAGNTGIVFDQIKAKYLAAAHQRKEKRIPSDMLQDDEIRRTLFELQSKGVLRRMEDNRYASSRSEDPAKIREELQGSIQNFVRQMQSVIIEIQEKEEIVKRELHKNMTDKFGEYFGIMQHQFNEFSNIIQEIQQQQIDAEHAEQIHRDIQRSTLEIVGRDPNRYTADQIAIDVMDRTKAARVIVMIQIISLLQNGILTQDGEGRVSIRLFQLPDKVLSPPAYETEKTIPPKAA